MRIVTAPAASICAACVQIAADCLAGKAVVRRRVDGIEAMAAQGDGRPHRDDVAWLIARVRRLEAVLGAVSLTRHVRLRVGDPVGACDALAGLGACNCGAAELRATADAVMLEGADV